MARDALRIEIQGLEKLMSKIRDRRLLRPIRDFMYGSIEDVRAEWVKRAPVGAHGRLSTSGVTEVERREPFPTWAATGPTVSYAKHVEFGTRPHFPPPRMLFSWVRLVLRVAPERVPEVAYLVARAIARRGTRAQPFMRPAAQAAWHKVRGNARTALRQMEALWQR